MKCPHCGSQPNFLIQTARGQNLYQCSAGLTTAKEAETPRFTLCDAVMDNTGKLFNGTVAYVSRPSMNPKEDNQLSTLIIRDGKIL